MSEENFFKEILEFFQKPDLLNRIKEHKDFNKLVIGALLGTGGIKNIKSRTLWSL
jgi:hypothetical protein